VLSVSTVKIEVLVDVMVGSLMVCVEVMVVFSVVDLEMTSEERVTVTVDFTVEVRSTSVIVLYRDTVEVVTMSTVVVTAPREDAEELVGTVLVKGSVETTEVVVVLLKPATKGMPFTWVKSIQLVLPKKLSSSN
jgi:hypothetical protein